MTANAAVAASTEWSDSTLADHRLLVQVSVDGIPTPVTAVFAGGVGLPAGNGGTGVMQG